MSIEKQTREKVEVKKPTVLDRLRRLGGIATKEKTTDQPEQHELLLKVTGETRAAQLMIAGAGGAQIREEAFVPPSDGMTVLTRLTSSRDVRLPNVYRSVVFTANGQERHVVWWTQEEGDAVHVLKSEIIQGPASEEYTMGQSAEEKERGLDAPVAVSSGTELLIIVGGRPEISVIQARQSQFDNAAHHYSDRYETIIAAAFGPSE